MSSLNLEPFELSKWEDKMVEIEIPEAEENEYRSIYSGLGTDENDLTFWYMPRNWKDWQWVNFKPDKDNINRVIVDITHPEERDTKLVHVDFSTSNLNFKPNTYYTFLLKLDFGFDDAKLPSWEKYAEANTGLDHHYLISLVRQDVPDSTWHMPKPIFDSSLAISYGPEGFNLRDCYYANPEEKAQLFVAKDGNGDVNEVYLLGFVKTNDFLKEHNTLGMWSFLESWVNDYWKAGMEIYVFEDNEGNVYNDLDPTASNSGNNSADENTDNTADESVDNTEESFSLKEKANESFRNILGENNFKIYFGSLYDSINNYIRKYYIDVSDYMNKFNNQTVNNSSEIDEDFKRKYMTDNTNVISAEIARLSKSAAVQFHKIFPDLCFKYKETNGGVQYIKYLNGAASDTRSINDFYYNKIINNNNYNAISDYLDCIILDGNILLPVKANNFEKLYFDFDGLDLDQNIGIEELIINRQNQYWENILNNNNNNNLYNYLSLIYRLEDNNLADFSLKQIIENAIDDQYQAINNNIVQLLIYRGFVLTYIPEFKNISLYIKNYIKNFLYKKYKKSEDDNLNIITTFFLGLIFTMYPELSEAKISINIAAASYKFVVYFDDNLNPTSRCFKIQKNNNKFQTVYSKISSDLFGTENPATREEFQKIVKSFLNIKEINSDFFNFSFGNKKKTRRYLAEEKQFVFGHQNAPQSFAQDVVLTESTKEAVNTLTFSLYNYYYNNKGEKEENPFINLLQEEDKIKLKYKDKWYDFILTDSNLDSSTNKWDYTAKDAHIIELSKIGFNKTFNTELDNNVGTIEELSNIAIEGTDWKLDKNKTEKFYQGVLRPVIGGKLKSTITIKASESYYDENLKRKFTEEKTLPPESFIYIFYNDDFSLNNFKILCPKNFNEDYEIVNNTLTNIFIYPTIKIYDNNTEITDLNMKDYVISNNLTIKLPNIFQDEIDFNYGLRAKDIVTKPKTHYSIPLKRYVTEYKNTTAKNNNVLYGYTESKYSTKPFVKNLIPNGEDFISLSGWINGTVNNIHNLDLYLGAAVREKDNISTISPYLNFITSVESGNNRMPHGFACNTELSYNFADINHLDPGDEFVLRVQVERGKNFNPLNADTKSEIDDQLTLMETMRPYLYFYDSSYNLQSNANNTENLPKKSQQVMNFIQNERYKLHQKIRSGLEEITDEKKDEYYKETGSDGKTFIAQRPFWWSNYSEDFYDLSETLDKQGLVPVYWNYLSDTDTDKYFPCVYIKSKTAQQWERKKYIEKYGNKVRTGNNKSYFFNREGQVQLAYLFFGRTSTKSNFNIRDIEIMLEGLLSNISINREGSTLYARLNINLKIQESNNSVIKYYCPLLFTDRDFKELYNNNLPEGESKIDFVNNKTFFRKDEATLRKIFETKEYYEMRKISGGFRAIPYNINIDFGDEEESIAHSSGDDYNDFDLLMRMRSIWYLHKYSKTDTCIFETQGTFYGRPIKKKVDNKDTYVYNIYSDENKGIFKKSQGYTYEDLLDKHLGLFLTFDQTRYDDGARGDVSLAISKIELFRKYIDEDGNIATPNKTIESNTTPIYHLYDPVQNQGITKKEDITYEYEGVTLNSDNFNYEPVVDLTGEKKNSITITESNCYNILQKIAEIFDAWLVIDVKHNDNGQIELIDGRPQKFIYFVNTRYNENFSGIKYGINLQKIIRKIDSNDTITKLIVKNNNNEFGKNSFCSIARSKYNFSGSNSIFNVDYLISIGEIPLRIRDILYNEIYPRTQSYGQFLSEMITERAELITLLSQTQSEAEYNKLIINDAKEKLADYQGRYEALDVRDNSSKTKKINLAYLISNEEARKKQTQEVQSIVNTIIFYSNVIDGYSAKYRSSTIEYNENLERYNILQNITESVTKQRDSLIDEFQKLCNGGRIKEGAWSSEDYIDDDLYYLDAERQLQEYIQPKVSYNIEVTDVSVLPGWEAYNFNLRDKTTMEDPEIFGYDENGVPIKIDIIITEKSSHLQSPDKNTITVQNYKTQFNDLFQRITSTIQAVEFGTLNYTNKNSDNNINNRISDDETSLNALKAYNKI